MTQPKLKQLNKLLIQFQEEMRSGEIFKNEPTDPPSPEYQEVYGAEVVGLVISWVNRVMD